MVTNAKVALNGDEISPYTISYKVQLADESVLRAYKVSPGTALSFAKRHGLLIPPLPYDFKGVIDEEQDSSRL